MFEFLMCIILPLNCLIQKNCLTRGLGKFSLKALECLVAQDIVEFEAVHNFAENM